MSDKMSLNTTLKMFSDKITALEEKVKRLDRILRIRTPIEKRCEALEERVEKIDGWRVRLLKQLEGK